MSGSSDTSSASKPKRNYMEDYLPLYKKKGESYAKLNIQDKTTENADSSNSKGSSKQERSLSKCQTPGKKAVEVSRINIDGTNLHSSEQSAGSCTPLNESKVTSTPLLNSKKTAKAAKEKLKKTTSTIEHSKTMDDVTSQSHKRSKSVSFLLNENDHTVIKKNKYDVSEEGATGDTPRKAKKLKYKKVKKSEKENEAEDDQLNVAEVITEKKHKKYKNKADKLKTEETLIQSIPDNKNDQEDSIVNERKFTKPGKKEKKLDKQLNTETNQDMEKTKKAKKQKHQDKSKNYTNNGEPAPKSPKTEVADHLENLNLEDNAHTLTNLIDKMTVVDKAKLKKLNKTANRENKLNQKETSDKNLNESETADPIEKKKWVAKRWNKRQVAERDQNITLNVDNLPVSLLKGNFKRTLIDLFSKYGLTRSVGEALIIDKEDPNSVFTTRIYFDTREAAAEALEMDGTTVAGNVIRVTVMRPMTETSIVLRIYGPPDTLHDQDIRALFKEVGLIRSIRPILKKKKSMSTVFVEFDGPEKVQRALQKCDNLVINGIKVMASQYVIINNEHKDKTKKIKKRKRSSSRNKKGNEDSEKAPNKNSKKVPNKNSAKRDSVEDSDSGDESEDE